MMKRWLYRIGLQFFYFCLALLLLVAAWWETDTAMQKAPTRNNGELPTIKPGWPGTPVDQKDRFMNHEYPFSCRARLDLVKWKAGGNSFKDQKQSDTARLEVKDPRGFYSRAKTEYCGLGMRRSLSG